MELPATQDGDTWNLRPISSNAGSSVSSPPADDPDCDESPYPHNLLRQHCDYPDTALQASPTSSNEADADLDTEDTEWDSAFTEARFPSLDESFSDPITERFNWDGSKEESPFDGVIIVQHGDDDINMSIEDQEKAP
jgi:hypothetical protein